MQDLKPSREGYECARKMMKIWLTTESAFYGGHVSAVTAAPPERLGAISRPFELPAAKEVWVGVCESAYGGGGCVRPFSTEAEAKAHIETAVGEQDLDTRAIRVVVSGAAPAMAFVTATLG